MGNGHGSAENTQGSPWLHRAQRAPLSSEARPQLSLQKGEKRSELVRTTINMIENHHTEGNYTSMQRRNMHKEWYQEVYHVAPLTWKITIGSTVLCPHSSVDLHKQTEKREYGDFVRKLQRGNVN